MSRNLQKPYQRRNMGRPQRVFNYRLSRARRVVENAFGILANRFRIFHSKMHHTPETIKLIVKTCLVLHNFMRLRYPGVHKPTPQDHEEDVDAELGRNVPQRTPQPDARSARLRQGWCRDGKELRDHLTEWVVSDVGSVPWQNRTVFREEYDDEQHVRPAGDVATNDAVAEGSQA